MLEYNDVEVLNKVIEIKKLIEDIIDENYIFYYKTKKEGLVDYKLTRIISGSEKTLIRFSFWIETYNHIPRIDHVTLDIKLADIKTFVIEGEDINNLDQLKHWTLTKFYEQL